MVDADADDDDEEDVDEEDDDDSKGIFSLLDSLPPPDDDAVEFVVEVIVTDLRTTTNVCSLGGYFVHLFRSLLWRMETTDKNYSSVWFLSFLAECRFS